MNPLIFLYHLFLLCLIPAFNAMFCRSVNAVWYNCWSILFAKKFRMCLFCLQCFQNDSCSFYIFGNNNFPNPSMKIKIAVGRYYTIHAFFYKHNSYKHIRVKIGFFFKNTLSILSGWKLVKWKLFYRKVFSVVLVK